jgi:phosphoglycolate phosphatase
MNIKNIIFDLDGTVIDTLVDLARALSDTLAEFHLPRVTLAQTRRLLGGGARQFVKGALKEKADDPVFFETFFTTYMKRYKAYQIEQSAPYPGMVDLLVWLKEHGIRSFIFSNKPHDLSVELIDHRLPGLFTGVHGHKPNTLPKPDRTMYDLFARDHQIDASQSVFVGDSEFDIEMGRVLHMPTIAVSYGYVDKPILQSYQPDYLVDTVEELKAQIIALRTS